MPSEAATLPLTRRRSTATATPNQVLAIVCVGIVLANLDLFIVNVGLPAIAHDFAGASLESLSWILNGYAITYAALLVFFGRLAERHRRDRSFLLGILLFTAASAACAFAGSVETLVLYRVLQAAGAALMTPTSIGLLLASFPPERRGAAVRTWAAVGGLAAALGPVAGGILIAFSWRWIFLVNVPIGLLALAVGAWKLPAVPGHDVARPSPTAAALVTTGIATLTFAIIKGNDWGWTSPGIAAILGVSIVSLALFVRHCVRAANPFVSPALFKVRPFTGASLIMAPYSIAFGALLFSVAVWEQTGWGWSALKTGLAIAPGPLLVPITSMLLAGRLIARFGAGPVITAGIFFFVACFTTFALAVTTTPSLTVAIGGMILSGIGVGLTFPTLMGIAASSLPPSSFATGSGVINMIRQSAIAIGVAIFVAVIALATDRLAAFRTGWWVMAGFTALALIPNLMFIRRNRN
jgi:EmrB/QacA subfamily drug resistance transporter